MKTHRLIFVLPGLLTVCACASGTRPVVPDGRDRVAANTPARITQFLARVGEESAAQQERSAWARQLDGLNRQLAELKTFVLLMQVQNEAKGGAFAPAVAGGRGAMTPAALTAPQPTVPAGRSLQIRPSEGPSVARLGLAPGETPVDDTPRPRRIAAADGLSAPANEPARRATAARPAAAGQPGPTKEVGPAASQPTASATVAADTAAKKVDAVAAPKPAASEPAATSVKPVATEAAAQAARAAASEPAQAAASAPARAATPTAAPAPKPQPRWEVLTSDVTVAKTVQRWATHAGYRVQWDAQRNFLISAPTVFQGDFEVAVSNLLGTSGIRGSDYPLEACIYANTPPLLRITRQGEQTRECAAVTP